MASQICLHRIARVTIFLLSTTVALLPAGQDNIRKKICHINCAKTSPAENYFQHGDVRIVSSPLGSYREAEGKPLSRFGYRFQVEHPGQPHLLVVRYPDDKRRFMCMMDGTCYDLTEGVFTGFNQPLSGRMLEIRYVFWPRWQDASIVFMTWSDGEPAAVTDFDVFELRDLPPLALQEYNIATPRRRIGVQFEDPCGKGMSLGSMTPPEWQDRLIQYLHYSGQNMLVYPLIWYHGPHYPSQIEPCQDLGSVVAPDRKMYSFGTLTPSDWVTPLLRRFEQENLLFKASMTLLRLGSLMRDMNIDLAAIQAGQDTWNNMRADNKVQDGVQDWTVPYNVRNESMDPFANRKEWAYGERRGTCSKGPMFNPLHPAVQKAVLAVIQEIAQKYGSSPAFSGMALNVWHATICWFATPEIGYDDYTIDLYSRESGVAIPVDARAKDRFSQRYEYLMKNGREGWLDWRCRKITEFFQSMCDVIQSVQPRLTLTVNLWTETTVSQLLGIPNGPESQLYARKNTYQLYRDGGIDIKMLEHIPGLVIEYVFVPSRDRDGWGTDGVNTKLEKLCMFRDHDFLDEITLTSLKEANLPAAWIFDSWVEAWGKYVSFPCAQNDEWQKRFAESWSVPIERITHARSEYPADGFWWPWQFRITPTFPAGIHYMEHYAHAVAELDALEISRGGLFLDTGHAPLMQPFVKAFRALPARKFDPVGDSSDPVTVRTLVCDGVRYLYLVNREYYPVKAAIRFKNEPGKGVDLASDKAFRIPSNWEISLQPFELKSFRLAATTAIDGHMVSIPADIEKALMERTEKALNQVQQLQNNNLALPVGTEQLLPKIREAMARKEYAWLRHALDSYAVRKCAAQAEAMNSQ
jgi:hypothetical protein